MNRIPFSFSRISTVIPYAASTIPILADQGIYSIFRKIFNSKGIATPLGTCAGLVSCLLVPYYFPLKLPRDLRYFAPAFLYLTYKVAHYYFGGNGKPSTVQNSSPPRQSDANSSHTPPGLSKTPSASASAIASMAAPSTAPGTFDASTLQSSPPRSTSEEKTSSKSPRPRVRPEPVVLTPAALTETSNAVLSSPLPTLLSDEASAIAALPSSPQSTSEKESNPPNSVPKESEQPQEELQEKPLKKQLAYEEPSSSRPSSSASNSLGITLEEIASSNVIIIDYPVIPQTPPSSAPQQGSPPQTSSSIEDEKPNLVKRIKKKLGRKKERKPKKTEVTTLSQPSHLGSSPNWKTHEIIPWINELISDVEEKGILQEGVYRLPGASHVIQEIARDLQENKPTSIPRDKLTDSNVCCSLIKKLLHEMEEPLLAPYTSLLKVAGETEDENKVKEIFQDILHKLDEDRRFLLIRMVQHFANISSNAQKNKMNADNLAMTFVPVFFKIEDLTQAQSGSPLRIAIRKMIEHSEWFQ